MGEKIHAMIDFYLNVNIINEFIRNSIVNEFAKLFFFSSWHNLINFNLETYVRQQFTEQFQMQKYT